MDRHKVLKLPYFRHEIGSPARIMDWTINGAIVYRCCSVLQGIGIVKVTWNINFISEVVYIVSKFYSIHAPVF